MAGLIVWFFGSPDLRFAKGLVWGLTALLGSGAVEAWEGRKLLTRGAAQALGVAGLVLALWPVQDLAIPPVTWWTVAGDHPVQLHPFVTRSGLVLEIPADSECWDTPPPCTPFPARGLRQRVPGELGSGFTREPGEKGVLDRAYESTYIPRYP